MRPSFRKRALIREVNDRIREINAGFADFDGLYEIYCECADTQCMERVAIPAAAYDGARAAARRFIVAPGHAHTLGELIVDEQPEFAVVGVARRRRLSRPALVAVNLSPDAA